AALEALACEVPVIASRAGGLPEVIEDGATGLLYEVGDVDGMARGAADLLADPVRHRAFALRARRSAVENFSEHRIVARYRDLYERVLAGAAVAPARK